MCEKCDICGEDDPMNFERCENCGKCCCDDCIDWCPATYDDLDGVNLCWCCQEDAEIEEAEDAELIDFEFDEQEWMWDV